MRRRAFLLEPGAGAGGAALALIEKQANEAELELSAFAELPSILQALRQHGAGEAPVAVVIGPGVTRALAAARSIRAAWSGHLLFSPAQADLPSLRAQLAVAPMIGDDWSLCVASDPNMPRVLRSIMRASAQRRQLRTTLDRANLRISARDVVDPARYRALSLTDRYFATILKQAAAPIVALDGRDVVTAWNRGAEEVFGIGSDQARGTHVALLAGWPARLNAALDEARAGTQADAGEIVIRAAQGAERHFRASVSAVRDDAGAYIGAAIILLDVTAAVRALAAEQAARGQAERMEGVLREADRRKDEFIATLAHELRNPLAPIRSAVDILGRLQPLPEGGETARQVLDRQTRHLTRLVDDLLEVSRITQGKLQLRKGRISLQRALHDAVDGARAALQAGGHQLSVQLPHEPVELDADVTRVTQIFLNLLNNAIKFTPRGGHVWLAAERTGTEAVVSVRDDGIGIPAQHLGKVFQMFSQVAPALERTESGLGIGLALVRGLVMLHGGTVEARSAGSGQGSEFVVRLPLATRSAGDTEASTPLAAQPQHPRKILVVDDNLDAAATLRRLLEISGHDVREAHDGIEAVHEAAQFRPEIVLLDIGMPRMNGYDAAREIRRQANGRAIRIVAVTGWGQESDKQRTLEAGFDLHLTKPVEPSALERMLTLE